MRTLLPHRIRPTQDRTPDRPPRIALPVSATPIYDQVVTDLGFDPLSAEETR